MCTNTFLFPDINVLVALAHSRHPHHETATDWLGTLGPSDQNVYCRLTQLGLLRVLSTRAAMGSEVLTQRSAWEAHDALVDVIGLALLEEPAGLDRYFRQLTSAEESSAKLWADAYLASFAEADGLTLVTFDRALAKMAPGAILLRAPQ